MVVCCIAVAKETALGIGHLYIRRQCGLVLPISGIFHVANYIIISNADIIIIIVSRHTSAVGMDISLGRHNLYCACPGLIIAGDHRIQCRPGGTVAMGHIDWHHIPVLDELQFMVPYILHILFPAGIGHQFACLPAAHLVEVGAVVLAGDTIGVIVEILCNDDAVEAIGSTLLDGVHISAILIMVDAFVIALEC